jgi:DNA-binding NarL/FixJ family response regulator
VDTPNSMRGTAPNQNNRYTALLMKKFEQHNKRPTHILIADDQICYAQTLKLAIENAGMKVLGTAVTGRQAVEATIQNKPDCLLLDISMPDMDGFAALANIKFLAPEICVIVISALTDPGCRTRALELGAAAFFSKDGSVDELVCIISKFVSERCHPPHTETTKDPICPTAVRTRLIAEDLYSSKS